MDQSTEIEHEDNPLHPGQVCVAIQDFEGQQEEDLPFISGEEITIVEACELMFWYKARNESGKTGIVPSPFLEPIEDKALAIATPASMPTTGGNQLPVGGDYVPMNPTAPIADEGYLHINPSTFQKNSSDPQDKKAFIAQEKEKRRRLKPGTLVMGICQFQGQEPEDLSFNVYEEMTIINPLPDLCWYNARKTDHPEQKGVIPVTHVTLVYMSDDEDDFPEVMSPQPPTHDILYDDVNDFLSQSGWFSFPGLAHGKVALQHVLAKKCKMTHEQFMATKGAVYKMTYRQDEKVFVGKASVLHEELDKHFDCFSKKRKEIREIDDELCHHTEMSGWEINVWLLQEEDDLEVECGKKIIENNALVSQDGNGINEEMTFENRISFDKFWDWFMPR